MRCEELRIEVTAKAASMALCRAIMREHPECAERSLEVRRDGKLVFITHKVSHMAQKTISEDANGLSLVDYKEFPRDRIAG